MEAMQRFFLAVGCLVTLALIGLGACEVYNKILLGEHLRPTLEHVNSDLD